MQNSIWRRNVGNPLQKIEKLHTMIFYFLKNFSSHIWLPRRGGQDKDYKFNPKGCCVLSGVNQMIFESRTKEFHKIVVKLYSKLHCVIFETFQKIFGLRTLDANKHIFRIFSKCYWMWFFIFQTIYGSCVSIVYKKSVLCYSNFHWQVLGNCHNGFGNEESNLR